MRYQKVYWDHDLATEPTVLYSEIDDQGWEVRKIELYADGRHGSADGSTSRNGTRLGTEAVPDIATIALATEFRPAEIDKSEFEAVWTSALEPV